MRIDVEDVYMLEEERSRFNRPELKDIEFYRDGKPVSIPDEVLEEWKFIGLNNIDFIMDYEWPEND